MTIDGDASQNLCVKAWHLLNQKLGNIPTVHIHLHKVIPMGAGLGGGSADGAFTLLLLNEKLKLGFSRERLAEFALQLGSDCPFFINNHSCFATGRGEMMTPVDVDLSAYEIVLVNPGIHVSTAQAFAGLHPAQPAESILSIISKPVTQWKNRLVNDFEATVFQQYPEIAEIKQTLYELGAVYAAMSGTGSTVFGLFEKGKWPSHPFPGHYWVFRAE